MAAEERVIDFMKTRLLASVISIVLVLGALLSLVVNGLNLGLDFTGGTLVEVGFSAPAPLAEVRESLAEAGFGRATVAHFGSGREVLIRLSVADSAKVGEQIAAKLSTGSTGEVSLRRTEFVGPQMGDELRDQGGLALLTSLLVVMLYVSVRFQWKLSVGAVVALVHDVIITLGAFSLFHWECDLTVLAAFLALIGYSINDTIVVYDRLRENFRKMRRMDRFGICNASLTPVSYTHLRAHETVLDLVCRLLLEKKTQNKTTHTTTTSLYHEQTRHTIKTHYINHIRHR